MGKRAAEKRKIGAVANGRPAAPPLVPPNEFGRTEILIAVTLAVVTLAVYAQVIGHHFIALDDDQYITENPMVNRGFSLAGIGWAFTTFHAANWHPLTWIAHMLDV